MRQARQEATHARLARGTPERRRPRQTRAQRSATPARCCSSGELEGVESSTAGCRAVAGRSRRRDQADSTPGMVVVDQEEFRRSAGHDRTSTGPRCARSSGRYRGHHSTRPTGAGRWHLRTTISAAGGGRRLLALAYWTTRGPRGRPTVRRPRARPAWRRPATSRTSSVPPSPWRTSGSRRVVSARRCAPTSEGCSLRRGQGSRRAPRGAADMHVGMSELLRERGDLARRQAAPADEQGTGRARRAWRRTAYRWRVAMARIRRPKGTWTARSTCSTRPSACT